MGQVEAYSRLAGLYDEIVIDSCHDRCASYLHELWSDDADGCTAVLDLCCGTGLLAGELIARGYAVVGSTPPRLCWPSLASGSAPGRG